MYAKFEVAGMKTPDNYGHTHTVYFSKLDEAQEERKEDYPNNNFTRRKREDAAEAKRKTCRASKAKKEKVEEPAGDLPF